MQHAGARQLREDDRDLRGRRPPRRLRVVEDSSSVRRADAVRPADPSRAVEPAEDEYVPAFAQSGRRTVKITGQPMPPRRRPSVTQSQIEARPDRVALWAFLLGLFLVFMAVATANAAPT